MYDKSDKIRLKNPLIAVLSIIIGIYLHFILFIILPYEIAILNNNNPNSLNNLLINNSLNLRIAGNFSTNYGYRSIWSGNTGLGDNNILFVSSKMWDGNITTEGSHITNIGNILYTNYNLWLILTSLILLLALVGAIVIVTKSGGGSSSVSSYVSYEGYKNYTGLDKQSGNKVYLNKSQQHNYHTSRCFKKTSCKTTSCSFRPSHDIIPGQ